MTDRPSDPVIDYALMAQRAQRAELERDALRAEVENLRNHIASAEVEHEIQVGARDASIRQLQAEVERLRNVLRELHADYCTSAWTDRGRHAPECRLYEIEEDKNDG